MDQKQRKALESRLEKIRGRNAGLLTPNDVVADAKSETSPLHSFFTWDDTEASHQFRLDQARSLIRNVQVEMTTSTRRFAVPFYIRDPRVGPDEQGYCATLEIKNDQDVATDALRCEFDRAIAVLQRAVTIADALGLSEQVQDLLQRAEVIHRNLTMESRQQAKGKSKA